MLGSRAVLKTAVCQGNNVIYLFPSCLETDDLFDHFLTRSSLTERETELQQYVTGYVNGLVARARHQVDKVVTQSLVNYILTSHLVTDHTTTTTIHTVL